MKLRYSAPQIASGFKLRALVGAQVLWVGLVCLLGAWWARLALKQAGKIEELELAAGLATGEAHHHWEKTQRMLYWESSTFFILVLITAAFLFWIYWSEMFRARSIQAFFASVTHELRTPLTSIRLQAESIADDLDSSKRPLVDRLMEDTQRLEVQVERMLELARLEGGGPVLLQPVQLKPWLERLIQSWRETNVSHSEKIELVLSLDVPDLAIDADPAALQVIFRNLLENSVRHSKKDKIKILITAKLQKDVPKRTKNATVLVTFEDDGSGYEGRPAELGKLFHRGSSSLGSGVGLYLVQALMRRMGGDSSFEPLRADFLGFRVSLRFPGESSHA